MVARLLVFRLYGTSWYTKGRQQTSLGLTKKSFESTTAVVSAMTIDYNQYCVVLCCCQN